MQHAPIAALVVAHLAFAGSASAEPCTASVRLEGDPALAAQVGKILRARGVELAPADCPAITVSVQPVANRVVVEIVRHDGTLATREVGEPQTAATVIESFTREDVEAPLLATRAAIPVARVAPTERAPVAVAAKTQPPARGIQLFGALETSYGSDRTTWLGIHLGTCLMLGPVCAAARLRTASVATGPQTWDHVERRSVELLVGIDIPFELGRATITPGFAAGLGQMRTRDAIQRMRTETGGLRADVHVTLTIPFANRFALDIFSAADLTQETHVEGSVTNLLPEEPRALLRLGVGLRYGGL
ncbi:MAG: hypothetical protein ABI867_39620 [Kofleriaceae bacterium]